MFANQDRKSLIRDVGNACSEIRRVDCAFRDGKCISTGDFMFHERLCDLLHVRARRLVAMGSR